MENAVKALIMVAGLIVGILVVGLLVYLFRLGGNVASNYDQSMSEGQIASFNAKFEPYVTTLIATNPDTQKYKNKIQQQSNTINDIVSFINLAYDINAKVGTNNIDDGIAITVEMNNTIKYYMNARILYDYYQDTISVGKRKKNIVFKNPDNYSNDEDDIFELNELIKENSNTKLITGSSSFPERIYQYYFDCIDVNYTNRGRINKMVFKRVQLPDYDSL